MRLTTEQKNNYKKYLIDCIDYDFSIVLESDAKDEEHILKYFFETFYDEYGWEIKRQGEQNALTEYLMNQPSVIILPCYYEEQIELAKKFGSIPQDATEKQKDKITNNFYNFFSNYLMQLKRSMKIN